MISDKKIVVGVDEVGRGPFAGPVVVCACAITKVLPRTVSKLITDSKKISKSKREECVQMIQPLVESGVIQFTLTRVGPKVIDSVGVGRATKRAVTQALRKLSIPPEQCDVRLDGLLHAPVEYKKQRTIIGGDAKEKSIGLASIIAKVDRDAYMMRQAQKYPHYGFEQHKGYGTAQHRRQIEIYGLSPLHRRSFIKEI